MENMEKISWRIWESEGLGKALLIGGLLFYLPIINLLLVGYFGLWARKLILQQGMELPEWREGRGIVNELGRVIAPFAVWVLAPYFLAVLLYWALSGLLSLLYLGFFAHTIALFPVTVVALLSPPAFVVSLIRLYASNNLREALDISEIIRQVLRHLRSCLFPLFQFYGILLIGWPLLGFAVFLATPPLLAQLVLIFRKVDEDLKSPGY